jgi:hypothetical protein
MNLRISYFHHRLLSKTGIIPLELSVTAVTFRVRGAV